MLAGGKMKIDKDEVRKKRKLIKEHRRGQNEKLKVKVKEAFSSVLPVTIIVLLLSLLIVPMDISTIALFLVGAVLLVLGMGFFQFGAEMSMTPTGEGLGTELSKTNKLGIIIAVTFVVGFFITIAEPDLQVLANQAPAIPKNVLIMTIAVGVGVFLTIAFLRVVYKISLSVILIVFYGVVFVISIFTPAEFLPVAFDSGGVTTGPMTVPFIMAMGVGFASLRSDKKAGEDSFGLVAISSVGPILMVLLLGIFFKSAETNYNPITVPDVTTTQDVMHAFISETPDYAKEMLLALLPMVAVFIIFQLITHRFKRISVARVSMGFVYTLVGLVLFLVGVNVGFLPVGHLLGSNIASMEYGWILIPIGMLIGFFIVKAEPAVQILTHQVEDITQGAISKKMVGNSLSIGVAVAVGISMVRILTGIHIMWILIPGYIISIALTFFVPKLFVGIAFDSGGVASGPMTSTFLLPFAIGACEGIGGNVMTDAFGVVAMVAMTPLIAVQIMGLVYSIKNKKSQLSTPEDVHVEMFASETIIEFEEIVDNEEQ